MPPITDGYVTYTTGLAVTNCVNGAPTSVRLTFGWDARNLNGAYDAQAQLLIEPPAGPIVIGGTAPVAITIGAQGTYDHAFPLPADVAGKTLSLDVNLGYYHAVSTSTVASCTGQPTAPLVAPQVTVTPDCAGGADITFTGQSTTQDWHWVLLDVIGGGFIPGGDVADAVHPGATLVRHMDQVSRLVSR